MVKLNRREDKNIVEENRIGRFRVRRKLIEEDPNMLLLLMAEMIIIKVEEVWAQNSLEYTAFSHYFKKNDLKVESPKYEIVVNEKEKGKFSFTTEIVEYGHDLSPLVKKRKLIPEDNNNLKGERSKQ